MTGKVLIVVVSYMVECNSLAIMLEFSEPLSMVAESKIINATTLGTGDTLIPLPLLACVVNTQCLMHFVANMFGNSYHKLYSVIEREAV